MRWKHIFRGEFPFVFTILENSKMAAPMDGPKAKPNDIGRCLNALVFMKMQDIASADINSDLMNDYFIT